MATVHRRTRSGIVPVYGSVDEYRATLTWWQRLTRGWMLRRVEGGQARLRGDQGEP